MLVIPAIDIKNGKCVRLVKGDYNKEEIFSGDPVSVAKKWNNEGAELIHIVDLNGARYGKMKNFKIIKKISDSVKIPIQVGGGIRNFETAEKLIKLGARIVLGTATIEDTKLITNLSKQFGPERICVAVDVRNDEILIRGWTKKSGNSLARILERIEKLEIGYIIFTNVERDGTLLGINERALRKVIDNISIPVIASGGISSLSDLRKLSGMGVYGAIVGMALYKECFDLKEAIECIRK